MPAARNLCLSGSAMYAQMIRLGFNSRRRSHIDFAPERSRGWNSFEPSATLISKIPSHLPKNGLNSDIDSEFMTSTAVRPATADETDATSAIRFLQAFNILQK
jgi:hypothetical protein